MRFLKDFLRNLLILLIAGIVIYFINPTLVGQVFQTYGALFGPLAIVMLVVFALPRKKHKD